MTLDRSGKFPLCDLGFKVADFVAAPGQPGAQGHGGWSDTQVILAESDPCLSVEYCGIGKPLQIFFVPAHDLIDV